MSVHYECVQGYNDRYIRNNKTNELMNWNTVCTLLNNLHEENNQLQSELKELTQKKNDLKELLVNSEPVLEQKELQKIIYKMVYTAIDEKIEKAEDGFQQTQDNWYQGQIDALKELKKELQHD